MCRSFFLLLVFVLASCSGGDRLAEFRPQITSIDDKKAALQSGEKHWKGGDSIQSYGRARSHQILDLRKWKVTDEAVTYDGDAGLATVISRDGYALTAQHVLAKNSRTAGILRYSYGPRRMHAASSLSRDPATGNLSVAGNVPVLYPFDGKPLERFNPLDTVKLRVVHVFPGRDLALIKLPPSAAPYFRRGSAPTENDWLFSSGSGISMSPFASAGRARWVNRAGTVRSSVPVAPGDSGGPLFDSRGRLVAIVTAATRSAATAARGMRDLQESEAVIPNWSDVDRLIQKDRRNFPSQ